MTRKYDKGMIGWSIFVALWFGYVIVTAPDWGARIGFIMGLPYGVVLAMHLRACGVKL